MIKRMRIFSGPNGSGKSSIIKAIRSTEVQKGKKLDFGIYVNADDIVQEFYSGGLDFSRYEIRFERECFLRIVEDSGLINMEFTIARMTNCLNFGTKSISINEKEARLKNDFPYERIAQIFAHYLRKKILLEEKKLSFETVFSHPSKIDIIKEANEKGYKVYLYFVSTEDPMINVHRVKDVRVRQKGHDVPKHKIIDRYYRSMDLMYEAAQHCYQVYFFDNSKEGLRHNLFAHFKVYSNDEKVWNLVYKEDVPGWFKRYYSSKVRPD